MRAQPIAADHNLPAPWYDRERATPTRSFAPSRSGNLSRIHPLKLGSGYNVGIRYDTILGLEKVGYREAHYKIPEQEFPTNPELPHVKLLGTGDTIASRLDCRTGAVIPAFSPRELNGSVPELADICNLETHKLFGVFSENMEQYITLAEKTGEARVSTRSRRQ